MTTIIRIDKRNLPLYLFIMLYPVLPTYLAINMSDALPLISASRILLIMLFCYSLTFKREKVVNNELKKFKKGIGVSLTIYILCEFLAFLPYVGNPDSIKELFSVVVEKALMLICLIKCIRSSKIVENCIRTLVVTMGVISSFAIIETITGNNLAYYLDFAGREGLSIAEYNRLGITRAEFTFSHPICLAVYIVVVFPLVIFCISSNINKTFYYILSILGILCLLLTVSRGPISVFFVIFLLALMMHYKNHRVPYYKILGLAALLIATILILNPSRLSFVSDIGKSLLNELGANYDINNWGGNATGILSRTTQFQVLDQVFNKHPLAGGGANFIFRNVIYIGTTTGTFRIIRSIDNQYLSFLINKGIMGFIGNVFWYCTMLFYTLHKTKYKYLNTINRYFFFSFLGYYLCLFAVCELTTDKISWIMYALFLAIQLSFYTKTKESSIQ